MAHLCQNLPSYSSGGPIRIFSKRRWLFARRHLSLSVPALKVLLPNSAHSLGQPAFKHRPSATQTFHSFSPAFITYSEIGNVSQTNNCPVHRVPCWVSLQERRGTWWIKTAIFAPHLSKRTAFPGCYHTPFMSSILFYMMKAPEDEQEL